MSNDKYFPPKYLNGQFHCPHCNVYSKQYWAYLNACDINDLYHHEITNKSSFNQRLDEEWIISKCEHCKQIMIWYEKKIIYPDRSYTESPNDDLSDEIKNDYIEATNILDKSPRAAAALLRLAIQKICIQLGEKGNNLNIDIGNLVKKGLNIQVQQSLDTLRVIGNNAVHPGQIDIHDDIELVKKMFKLINFIAEKMITEPKEINQLYSDILPDSVKDHIKKRDDNEVK